MQSRAFLEVGGAPRRVVAQIRAVFNALISEFKCFSIAKIAHQVSTLLPSGGTLPEDVWRQRHRFLVGLTWFHAAVICLVGPVLGYRWELSFEALFEDDFVLHTLGEGLIVALFAALATWSGVNRILKAVLVGLGLMSSSAILVHLSGGYIELHFHFFVMIIFLALYQDWIPFIIGILYVAIHHGAVGVLWPEKVYNHPAAIEAPWTWASIHAFFVLSASIGSIIAWRYNEKAHAQAARSAQKSQAVLERIRTLHDVSTAMTSTLDLHDILNLFLKKIDRVLPYSASNVRLLNPETEVLEPIACRHIDAKEWKTEEPQSGLGLPTLVFQRKAPVIVYDLQSDPRVRNAQFFSKHGWVSYLGVPLVARDEIIGVLSFYTKKRAEFRREEVEFVSTLAGQASIAIHNSQLYERTRKQALALEESNTAKDELLLVMSRQKEELSRLNAGLEREVAERGQARAEIAAKNRDLETLLYVTSHDLREPLRAIENFSRIVKDRYDDRLDDKGRDFLRRVISGAQRLNRLLDDILTLSRLQRMGIPSDEVAGEAIVIEAVKRLDGKIAATDAQVHVAKDFHGLRVDKTWATQAVYNLVANALKFTRDGEAPNIEIVPYQPGGPESQVVGIAVRDRGPGVAPEHAERIFQLFQRAVGREVEGTGAGLAIVRQIAERHGGKAWVEEREGGGAEFIVTFGPEKHPEGVTNDGHAAHGDPAG